MKAVLNSLRRFALTGVVVLAALWAADGPLTAARASAR